MSHSTTMKQTNNPERKPLAILTVDELLLVRKSQTVILQAQAELELLQRGYAAIWLGIKQRHNLPEEFDYDTQSGVILEKLKPTPTVRIINNVRPNGQSASGAGKTSVEHPTTAGSDSAKEVGHSGDGGQETKEPCQHPSDREGNRQSQRDFLSGEGPARPAEDQGGDSKGTIYH